MDPDSILKDLNKEQREAVIACGENLLVNAGAGTGKTAVLAHRFAWLVSTGQARPGEILTVTFSKKSAHEMRSRVWRLLKIDFRDPDTWVRTFHGIANKILRAHPEEAGLDPKFKIIPPKDAVEILMSMNFNRDEAWGIYRKIAEHKDWNIVPSDPDLKSIFERYNEKLGKGYADFGDLMTRSYKLLEDHPEIQERYIKKFSFVIVDEFHDTSPFQYEWLKQFRGINNQFHVVGDDDQSIYGFRGVDPEILRIYKNEFDARTINLVRNYRSQPTILRAANALIRHNTNRIGKILIGDNGRPQHIRLKELTDDWHEANYVSKCVESLLQQSRHIPSIAVIFRTNAQSHKFEQRMHKSGIPYQILEGVPFSSRKEIITAIAYLRFVLNVNDRDAFFLAIKIPPRGIDAGLAHEIANHPEGVWAGIRSATGRNKTIDSFSSEIQTLLTARIEGKPPSEMVRLALECTGLLMYYQNKGDTERFECLNELVSSAIIYEQESGSSASLEGFLSSLILDNRKSNSRQRCAVSLTTAHAAKGLEFDVVFIVGVEDGIFPHFKAQQTEEEERRLMYVAITRTRSLLYITHAKTRWKKDWYYPQDRSKFIREIPDDVFRPNPSTVPDDQASKLPNSDDFDSDWNAPPPQPRPVTVGECIRGILLTPRIVAKANPTPPRIYRPTFPTFSRRRPR